MRPIWLDNIQYFPTYLASDYHKVEVIQQQVLRVTALMRSVLRAEVDVEDRLLYHMIHR
jgi:hypothetical protein